MSPTDPNQRAHGNRSPKMRIRIHYATADGQPLCAKSQLSANNRATTVKKDVNCSQCRRLIGMTPQSRGRPGGAFR